MADTTTLKDKIRSTIYPNGKGAINALEHQSMLLEMADVLIEANNNIEVLQTEQESNSVAIEDLQDNKADRGGYEPDLSVGVADHLAGHDEPTASEFTFRRSGGGAILSGNARVQSVKGNSVVWNQKADGGYVDGERIIYLNEGIPKGHVFCMQRTISNGACWYLPSENSYKYQLAEGESGGVFTNTLEVDATYVRLYCTAESGYVRLIDLTQMFGAGNEPQTIDDFYSRIPQGIDMDAYNGGEVIHMDVQSIESQGANAWDEEWEVGNISVETGGDITTSLRIRTKNYIQVIGGESYVITMGNASRYSDAGTICYYDNDKRFISATYPSVLVPFTIPTDAKYIRIGFIPAYGKTYNHDICINLSDASINGKYFPYVKRMQSLNIISRYFPDGMKSAGNAHDEIRYNKATQKWEAVKRIGEVDLGTLDWILTSLHFRANLPSDSIVPTNTDYNGYLCAKYERVDFNLIYGQQVAFPCFGVPANNPVCCVSDSSYTDAATFKAAMQGVILYYELANPIVTEIEEAFNLDYEVWNGGTEHAIADTPTSAFKADIIYGFNAYGVIKELREQLATLQAVIAKMNA